MRGGVIPRSTHPAIRQALASVRGHFVFVVVFSFFVNVLMLTGPVFMLQIYERVLTSRSEQTLLALFLLVVGLYAIMGVLDHLRHKVMARAGVLVQDQLSERAFRGAVTQALTPAGGMRPSAAVRNLDDIQSALSGPGPLALFDLPWLPIYLLVIYTFHPLLGVLATVGGVVIVLLALLGQVASRRSQAEMLEPSLAAAGVEQAALRDAGVIRALGMQGAFSDRWRVQKQESQWAQLSHSATSGAFRATAKSFRLLLQSKILALGAYLVLQGGITPGVMIVASIMMGRALAPVDQLTGSYGSLQKARLARQQLNALFFEQPQPPEKPDLPRPLPSIKAANLSVGPFGTSTPLVKGLNFSVRPGEALGIIGPSGSGKSSIAKTLAGIWPTLTGELRLGGATFNQWDQDVFGRFVGYMPQQPSLFQGTVAENIARFDPEATMAQVVAAAELAGAHEMILELPRGYETEIGHGANEVSGGQALRISLARALFGDPVLVILDEPNSFLDGQGEQALFKAIRTVKERGATVVIVAHSPAIILDCETTLVIVDGYQQEFGPTKEIVARNTRVPTPPEGQITAASSLSSGMEKAPKERRELEEEIPA